VRVVGFTSAKGSPGVSTTVLGLGSVWPGVLPDRRVLVVEADPAGGDAACGFLQGRLDPSCGLLALAAQRGGDPVASLWGQLVALDPDERSLLLAGVTDPSRAAALDGAWTALAEALLLLRGEADDLDVLLDLGRLGQAHDPIALRAATDLLVLVCGSSAPAVQAARAAARRLREESSTRLELLVVAPARPYPPAEVAESCDLSLLGTLPHDPGEAAVWQGLPPGWRHGRSPLVRGLRTLAVALTDAVDAVTVGSTR
jgi:hypothetical protein